jgi:hypothetical protein
MREVLVYRKVEMESATFIHALIRLDCKHKVQDVVRVREFRLPCLARL